MKKNYQAPKTRIFKIETMHIIAASPDLYNTDATGAAMDREGGDWFSED